MQDEQPAVALMHLKKFLENDPRHPNVRSAVYIMGRIYDTFVLLLFEVMAADVCFQSWWP